MKTLLKDSLFFFSVDDQEVPLAIQMSAKAVLQAESAIHKAEVESAAGTWDGEKIDVSTYAKDLKQNDNGVKISPKNWKCAECDLTTNLWLNLTDGSILCGRKFFDGSGGNNHAVEHYKKVGHPLAGKLGRVIAKYYVKTHTLCLCKKPTCLTNS